MAVYLSRVSSDKIVFLVIVFSLIALLLLAFIFIVVSFFKKSSQRRIRIPAMQEAAKPQRREKSEALTETEKAAIIAVVLAICTENHTERPLRVVSFRRIH